jgi:hypothetical protein
MWLAARDRSVVYVPNAFRFAFFTSAATGRSACHQQLPFENRYTVYLTLPHAPIGIRIAPPCDFILNKVAGNHVQCPLSFSDHNKNKRKNCKPTEQRQQQQKHAHDAGALLPICALWRQATQLHAQTVEKMAVGHRQVQSITFIKPLPMITTISAA